MTMVESQATIGHGMGDPSVWRSPAMRGGRHPRAHHGRGEDPERQECVRRGCAPCHRRQGLRQVRVCRRNVAPACAWMIRRATGDNACRELRLVPRASRAAPPSAPCAPTPWCRIRGGSLSPAELVWREGMATWKGSPTSPSSWGTRRRSPPPTRRRRRSASRPSASWKRTRQSRGGVPSPRRSSSERGGRWKPAAPVSTRGGPLLLHPRPARAGRRGGANLVVGRVRARRVARGFAADARLRNRGGWSSSRRPSPRRSRRPRQISGAPRPSRSCAGPRWGTARRATSGLPRAAPQSQSTSWSTAEAARCQRRSARDSPRTPCGCRAPRRIPPSRCASRNTRSLPSSKRRPTMSAGPPPYPSNFPISRAAPGRHRDACASPVGARAVRRQQEAQGDGARGRPWPLGCGREVGARVHHARRARPRLPHGPLRGSPPEGEGRRSRGDDGLRSGRGARDNLDLRARGERSPRVRPLRPRGASGHFAQTRAWAPVARRSRPCELRFFVAREGGRRRVGARAAGPRGASPSPVRARREGPGLRAHGRRRPRARGARGRDAPPRRRALDRDALLVRERIACPGRAPRGEVPRRADARRRPRRDPPRGILAAVGRRGARGRVARPAPAPVARGAARGGHRAHRGARRTWLRTARS